jgi:peptidyl-prolyl cis-trans isomerase SurA
MLPREPFCWNEMRMKRLIQSLGLVAMLAAPALFAQAIPVEPLDKIVAVVDEDVILQSELDRAVANILAQAQAAGSQLPPRDVIEKQVLERLILNRVQVERATSTGIQVGDSEIDQAVARIASQNQMSLEQLRASLERDGFNFEEFRKSMREELITQRFRQRYVQSRVQVTDTEIDILLAGDSLKTGEVRLQHILVGVPDGATAEQVQTARERAERVVREIEGGLTFQQAAIKYSEGQQALEGGDLGWRRYEEVPSAFAELVAGMNKGDVSQPLRGPSGFHIIRVADQREDNSAKAVREYKARHLVIKPSELQTEDQAIARIQKLRDQAVGGADFAELARKNSQDDNTANLGGDLGWFVANEYGERVGQVVDSLKNGEVSEPFRTDLGWHILKREDSRERDRTQDYLRAQARDAIMRRKGEEEFENYLRQIKAEAYIENRLAG